MNKLKATREYAQKRANDTRRRYIVSAQGHAMLDCALNRRVMLDLGGIAETFKPQLRIRS